MERKIFHGAIKPADLAHALLGEFNQGNLRAQVLGQGDRMIVQVGTRQESPSGGQTAMTVTIAKHIDGVIVEIGQQAWLGIAASLGMSALTALKNPLALLGRLDDIAQDIENLQLSERIWQVITRTTQAAGVTTELSERLKRLTCEWCGTANPVGEGSCIACGAPLGANQPGTCRNCGFILRPQDQTCPHCGQAR